MIETLWLALAIPAGAACIAYELRLAWRWYRTLPHRPTRKDPHRP